MYQKKQYKTFEMHCLWCGKPYLWEYEKRPTQLYCSVRCRHKANNHKATELAFMVFLHAGRPRCQYCNEFLPFRDLTKSRRLNGCANPNCANQRRAVYRKAQYEKKVQKDRLSLRRAIPIDGPLRPCRSLERRGYKSRNCDGKIHSGNWWFCDACDSEYTARPSCQVAEYSVGTIDLSHMGVMR